MPADVSNAVIRIAQTDQEKERVYRLRYDVYVEEMGRYQELADHENRQLVEAEDANSHIFYAELDGKIVATARLSWGGNGAISQRQIDHYSLQRFVDEVPAEAISVGERGMVVSHLRGSTLLLDIMKESLRFANERRIQLCFGACEPHLLNLYLGLGQRTYSHQNINSSEAGYLIPLVFVTEDVEYIRKLDSPLIDCLRDFGQDARLPEEIDRLVSQGGSVLSRRLSSPITYQENVHVTLDQLQRNRVSAFDGLSDEEESIILGKSNIIHCNAGDRVLKKGGIARNLFIVLQGTLEVRQNNEIQNILEPGDVFGEIAFLLERPRTMDVYAATDGIQILSLSENTIRMMIESDGNTAAKFLLNVSKMLCHRLIRDD